jgi:hypothetical protein
MLALLFISCATWTETGRLVNNPCLHVGLRPATDGAGNGAATLQISTDWPAPCQALDAGVDR